MARRTIKRRGCRKCAVIYMTPDGLCPICGHEGDEDLRSWRGSMPPSGRNNVWTPHEKSKESEAAHG